MATQKRKTKAKTKTSSLKAKPSAKSAKVQKSLKPMEKGTAKNTTKKLLKNSRAKTLSKGIKSDDQQSTQPKVYTPEIVEAQEYLDNQSNESLRDSFLEQSDRLDQESNDLIAEEDATDTSDLSLELSETIQDSGERGLAPADPVAMYLASIRKYPLLTREAERALAVKYFETKDPSAAQALVTSNLRFVVKIAAEYSRFGAKLIDLIQEGNIGLMHAVREFNPYKNVRLITYAVWWIRGYIQEYLMRQYSMVRIGTTQNQRKLFYQLQREKKSLDALGELPDTSVIAKKLGISEEEVAEMQKRMSGRDVSLDQPLDDSSSSSLLDLQKSHITESLEDTLAHSELIEILKEKISEIREKLSEREKIILEERLLADEPLTLQEIADKYGITREAVRQMETRVIKKIKDHFLPEVQTSNEDTD